MSDGNVILPTNHILARLEERSLEIDGMENWDCKSLLEIIFLYTPNIKHLSEEKQAYVITSKVITRVGENNVLNTKTPQKIISLIYKYSKEILKVLKDAQLDKYDVQFKTWLGNDAVVRYFRNPNGDAELQTRGK